MKPRYWFGLLILFLAACLFLLHSFYLETKEEALDQLGARQELVARQAADGIRNVMEHWVRVLEKFSELDDIINFNAQGRKYLDVVLGIHHKELLLLARVGPSGDIIGLAPEDRALVGQKVPGFESFIAVRETGRLAVSDVIASPRGLAAVSIHVPVASNGEFRGTVSAVIDFRAVAQGGLSNIKIGETGYAWMIDSKGVELFCPVPGHEGKSVFENCRDYPEILNLAHRMLKKESGTAVYTFDRIKDNVVAKERKRAFFLPVPLGDSFWSIAVASSEREALASLQDFNNSLFLLVLFLVLGWTALSYFWIKNRRLMIEEKKGRQAREAIHRSEEKYSRLFTNSPIGVFRTDPNWFFESANPAFAAILGLGDPAALAGRPWNEFISFPDPVNKEELPALLEKFGRLTGYEALIRRNDGASRRVSIFAQTEYGDNGKIEHQTGFVIDVTQRKQAEDALLYRAGLEHQLLRISSLLRDLAAERLREGLTRALEILGGFIGVDRAFLLLFGEDRTAAPEILEWRSPDLEPPDRGPRPVDPRDSLPWLVQCLGSGQVLDLPEVNFLPGEAGAEKKYLEERGVKSFFAAPLQRGETLVGFLGLEAKVRSRTWPEEMQLLLKLAGDIFRGALEKAQAEKALRESEEKYRLLVDSATDAIFIAQDEVIKFPNSKTEQLTGYSARELAGFPFIRLIHPDDRDMVLSRHRKRVRGEEPPTLYSFRLVDQAGREKWVQLNTAFIMWEGRPGTLNFLRDITDHKILESQLRHAQKMEAVGALAGGVAHDFNNLLQAINGFTQLLLLEKEETDSGFEELTQIKKASDRAAGLVKQLLAFSRKAEIDRRPLDLNHEIGNVRAILERTIPKMIEIRLELDMDLRPVNADAVQIEQVLLNLCANAADAMKDGGVLTLKTSNTIPLDEPGPDFPGLPPESFVLLSVSDTGHGMDRDTMEHIFEPFFTTKDFGQGTGLGLASAYGIIKSHGGVIYCHSEVGQGAAFFIQLPALDAETQVDPDGSASSRLSGGSETVLVVDDEVSVRELARLMFRRFGYAVLTASSGEEALEIMDHRSEKPDLIILDLGMPGMGGLKCLGEIIKRDPRAKVIVASGYSASASMTQVLADGAAAFLTKPYQLDDIISKARAVLDGLLP
ncbi:MAG: PAS domain S-box protein [Pseudomonadota bacterium]